MIHRIIQNEKRPYTRWTHKRDVELAYCWRVGLTMTECSLAMGCTERAVKARIEKLRNNNPAMFPRRLRGRGASPRQEEDA